MMDLGNLIGKKNKILAGFDLGDQTSQISYCHMNEEEPETISVIAGEEQFDFPTALARKADVNQWLYGREAMEAAWAGTGIPVEGLLSLALAGEGVRVGEETFDPVSLLDL